MHVGQRVVYTPASGEPQEATLVAIVGVGASNYKRLDLALGTLGTKGCSTVKDVPHQGDAPTGASCWRLPSEEPVATPAAPAKEPPPSSGGRRGK